MKIGKKSWLTIALGFLIIAAAGLSLVYFQHLQEREQLKEDLGSTRSRLNSVSLEALTQRQNVLEEDFNRARTLYEAEEVKLVQSVENIVLSDVLYTVAGANSVNITEMHSSDIFREEVEGVSCLALALDAKANGNVDNLIAFITQLNVDLATAVVKSVSMDIPPSDSSAIPSASIKLVIYTYRES